MSKKLIFLMFFVISLNGFSQKLRDSVYFKFEIFEVMYSEVLEQPLWVKYTVLCPNGTASRAGMDFYINNLIHTSDWFDYYQNMYDKGHLAPAANFNCTTKMLYMTFTYLNCSLQQQDLNRTTWKLLEDHERKLKEKNSRVDVKVICVFSKKSIKLSSGATVPDGFYKLISYGKKIEKYYFKNEKPKYSDYLKYRVK